MPPKGSDPLLEDDALDAAAAASNQAEYAELQHERYRAFGNQDGFDEY